MLRYSPEELTDATHSACLSSFVGGELTAPMADLEGFADLIWTRIGTEGREQVRQSWEAIGKVEPELRLKVYACFLWATWSRGKGGMPDGRPDYWDRV